MRKMLSMDNQNQKLLQGPCHHGPKGFARESSGGLKSLPHQEWHGI
jgi:hypothetical protein